VALEKKVDKFPVNFPGNDQKIKNLNSLSSCKKSNKNSSWSPNYSKNRIEISFWFYLNIKKSHFDPI
jgi:hypothetical protein